MPPYLACDFNVQLPVFFSETLAPLVMSMDYYLVVSTHLKNINQNGNLPKIGVKIKKMKPQPRLHAPTPKHIDLPLHDVKFGDAADYRNATPTTTNKSGKKTYSSLNTS